MYRSDFPNMITLWYGYRLIQTLPAIFQATQTLPENTMDPYDALHAFYLITTIHNKRRTALRNNKPFDTKCTIRHKPCTKGFPACGPSGVGNLADVLYDPQKIDPNIAGFHFGSFASQRRRLAFCYGAGDR
jgi:hypothetical protein